MWPLWALKVAGIVKRVPWQAWAGLALLIVWAWERDRHADARETEVRAEMQVIIDRMEAARQAAVAESEMIAALNEAATEKADTDAKRFAETDRADADRFIAANRVPRCPAARADAPASGESAGRDAAAGALPVMDDGLPASLVAVPESDILICTENTRRLIVGREWALTTEANMGAKTDE